MSYVTYTTEALVCGTYDRNTADRSYLLFTKEAGMLYADARSVRTERSRQRYALQDFSLVRVSLIKGKHGWRIGSIQALKNYYQLAIDKAARGSVVSIYRLLRRFVKGEEVDGGLFSYIKEALEVVSAVVPERQFVQTAIQVQVLALLGYVDWRKIPEYLHEAPPAELLFQYTVEGQRNVESLYTQAVSASHL